MSEAGSLSKYTPSADEMGRALAYWGHMTRENARAAVNRRIDFIKAEALREAARAATRDKSITDLARATIHTWVYNYADRIESEARP